VNKSLKTFSETLRKYPPLPMLSRQCSKPCKIPGTDTFLEKGILVFIPMTALQHAPKYYPETDRFEPERFSEEKNQKRHHYVYLPIGEGPRICVGKLHT
jgi:cytochrome P450 family 6